MGFPQSEHFIVLFKGRRYLIFSFSENIVYSFIPVSFWKEGKNTGKCYITDIKNELIISLSFCLHHICD